MFALILAAILILPPPQSDAVIGVSAIHLETGKRLSVRNMERFPMGSVYKFPIALAVLKRVDAGTLSLQQVITIEPRDFAPGWSPLRDAAHKRPIILTLGELLEHMISQSDNTASDALLKIVGPVAVNARLAELGSSGIRIDRSEKQMAADIRKRGGVEQYAIDARDTSTPDGMADLLETFWKGRDGLTRESHALLVDLMTQSPTGARKLRAALPAGWSVAHKSGSMPGTSNDVGVLTSPDGKQHIVLAIFSKRATSADEVVDADIAAIARKVIEELGR